MKNIGQFFANIWKSVMTYFNEPGGIAQNTNKKELVKMDDDKNVVEVTMQWKDSAGKIHFNLTAQYLELTYPGVVKIENTLCGAMMALGEEAAQAKPV